MRKSSPAWAKAPAPGDAQWVVFCPSLESFHPALPTLPPEEAAKTPCQAGQDPVPFLPWCVWGKGKEWMGGEGEE